MGPVSAPLRNGKGQGRVDKIGSDWIADGGVGVGVEVTS